MEIEQRPVSVPEALGVAEVGQPLPLEAYDLETSDRIRVVSDLEKRLPLRPDIAGRRYYWMDGLGVAAGHPRREFFDRHADQCFFELVDNVHRWAGSTGALAVVSATSGGGDESHNRLQVVVVDNGIGIVCSAKKKAQDLLARGQPSQCLSTRAKPDEQIAVDVISDLLTSVYGNRGVIGARGGHGLNTISKYVSLWNGTMNVISSFAENRIMHRGRRGGKGKWKNSRFTVEGITGTLVHLTLDAVKQDRALPSETQDRELVPV